MFAQLTNSARQVLDDAQNEARKMNQQFVSTEHMALAVLARHGTLASRLLQSHRVDREAVRTDMLTVMPFSEQPPGERGALPLSPKAQRCLNHAIVLARNAHEAKLSTRLLLLALLDDSGGSLLSTLQQAGADVQGLLRDLQSKPPAQEE